MEQRVEGFGISLAEASACGVPVVAGRSGGIPAAVREGETGILVDADRPEAVAEALAGLLDDAALRARLGAAGRRAVESHYNWDRVTGDLVRIGRELGSAAKQVDGLMPSAPGHSGHRGVRPAVPGLGRAARTRALSISTGGSPTCSGGSARCSAAIPRGKRVLDFGCMDGIFTLRLQQLGGEAVGYDISPAAIAQAKRFRGAAARPVFTTVPPGPGQFDRIYCNEILEHVADDSA